MMSEPDQGAGQPGYWPGRQNMTGIIGNMVPVNLGFHTQKEFIRKLSAIWARTLKKKS
jgi:hypothetical protein